MRSSVESGASAWLIATKREEGTDRWGLRHTDIAEHRPELISDIVGAVTSHPLGYAALRPLILLEGLPGRDRWIAALDVEEQDGDWELLGDAVLKTLDHQSQESTDVRWLTLLLLTTSPSNVNFCEFLTLETPAQGF